MTEVVQELGHFKVEEVTGDVPPRDYLMLAGIYKQVHPELSMASQPIVDLAETLNRLADPWHENSGLLIARRNAFNRAVGAAMLRVVDEPETSQRGTVIDEIFVEKRSRNQSVGRLLLAGSIEFAQRKGSDYIQLGRKPLTVGGQRLFEAMDFKEDNEDLLRLDLGK